MDTFEAPGVLKASVLFLKEREMIDDTCAGDLWEA